MASEPDRRFPSAQRLTRKADLDVVRHEGKRFRTAHLEVRYIASLLRHPRVGIIVPRHKQSAVARNRVKRRLRELVRLTVLPVLRERSPLDVVVRAMPSAYNATFEDLTSDTARATRRFAPAPGNETSSGAAAGTSE